MVKISKNKSFSGWNFGSWFKGNWSTVKELLKVGLPLMVSMNFFGPMGTGMATIIGKFVLDAGEFYFKQITLK